MKRFVLFDFPDHEAPDLAMGIIGTCDNLDDALKRIDYSGSLQALDMQTGDIWEYIPRAWKKLSNVSTKPQYH